MRIVITGTPGVGKTHYAKLLGKVLGAEVIDVNKFAISKGLTIGKGPFDSKIIDIKRLQNLLNKFMEKQEKQKKITILEGHLLCDMEIKADFAIVLREHLTVLKKRLEKRGYSKEKIKENLIAEATDYCGQHAVNNYRRVYEFLSSDKSVLEKLVSLSKGRKVKSKNIELLEELVGIMRSEKNFGI